MCESGAARRAGRGERRVLLPLSLFREGRDRNLGSPRAARQTFIGAPDTPRTAAVARLRIPRRRRRARRTDPRAVSLAASPNTRVFFATSARLSRSYPVGLFLPRVPLDNSQTTAHRPTWRPPRATRSRRRAHVRPLAKHSKLDDNAHTILKLRCVRARVLPSHARSAPTHARLAASDPNLTRLPNHAAEPTSEEHQELMEPTSAPSSRSARRNISRRSSGTAPRAPRTPTPRASPRPPTTTTTDRSCREIPTPTIATTAKRRQRQRRRRRRHRRALGGVGTIKKERAADAARRRLRKCSCARKRRRRSWRRESRRIPPKGRPGGLHREAKVGRRGVQESDAGGTAQKKRFVNDTIRSEPQEVPQQVHQVTRDVTGRRRLSRASASVFAVMYRCGTGDNAAAAIRRRERRRRLSTSIHVAFRPSREEKDRSSPIALARRRARYFSASATALSIRPGASRSAHISPQSATITSAEVFPLAIPPPPPP